MVFLANWLEAEHGRFVLWLPVAMLAGILLYFSLGVEPPLWLGFAATAIAAALLVAGWRFLPARFAAAMLFCAALGFARVELRTAGEPPLMPVPYGAVMVSGRVAAVESLANGVRLTLRPAALDAQPVLRAVRVKLRADDPAAPVAGQHVLVRALLFKPDRPAYPGAWDSGRDAFFAGVGATGFAIGDLTVTAPAQPGGLMLRLTALREAIAGRILAVLPLSTGSIAVTLLTGFQQQIPTAERQAFIAAGLAHLLAVAGLHVGIVMGLFFAVTRVLLARFERTALFLPGKAVASVVAWLSGAVYAALTGAHLPILRSLAMASLVTLAIIVGRRAISLRALALAAVLLMLLTPEAVIGVSFQMSFSAVAALIAGYAAVEGRFVGAENHAWLRLLRPVAMLFYTSLLAGAASMPFAAFQFQQVQPYWILANLVAVPLTALWILPLGLCAIALMPLKLAAFALVPMGWGIAAIVWLSRIIASWPDAMLVISPVPGTAILCFALGLAWLCLWRSRARLAGIFLMLAGFAVYAASRPPDALISPDGRLIAVASPPGVLLLRQPRAAGFVLSQWRPVWPGTAFTLIDPLQCANGVCRVRTRHDAIVIALSQPTGGCPPAALILSPVPLHGRCRGSVVIDRFTVWREGAVAAWLANGHVRLLTDRQVQGVRPWVQPWPRPYRHPVNDFTT